jgi:hypothetical protein
MKESSQIERELVEIVSRFSFATDVQRAEFHRVKPGRDGRAEKLAAMLSLDSGKYVVEVAWGFCIDDKPIYGVTVVLLNPARTTDLSTSLYSLRDLSDFLQALDTPGNSAVCKGSRHESPQIVRFVRRRKNASSRAAGAAKPLRGTWRTIFSVLWTQSSAA